MQEETRQEILTIVDNLKSFDVDENLENTPIHDLVATTSPASKETLIFTTKKLLIDLTAVLAVREDLEIESIKCLLLAHTYGVKILGLLAKA